MMKKVSVDSFSSDPMFPRMERVIAEQLAKGNVRRARRKRPSRRAPESRDELSPPHP
jgi:hypothetical protein